MCRLTEDMGSLTNCLQPLEQANCSQNIHRFSLPDKYATLVLARHICTLDATFFSHLTYVLYLCIYIIKFSVSKKANFKFKSHYSIHCHKNITQAKKKENQMFFCFHKIYIHLVMKESNVHVTC